MVISDYLICIEKITNNIVVRFRQPLYTPHKKKLFLFALGGGGGGRIYAVVADQNS